MMSLLLRSLACLFAGACAACLTFVVRFRVQQIRARRAQLTFDDVVQDRVLCFTALAACASVCAASFDIVLVPFALAVAFAGSGKAPQLLARRRHRELRRACDAQLDTLADVLSMGARAGMSFDASLALYCAKFAGPLSQLMHATKLKWETGLVSRERALSDCASDLGSEQLQRLVDTVLQALQKGAPLADALSKLASDLRAHRRNVRSRRVEKAPVKMLIPTGTCILPAMLILVMGPMLIQFLQSGY